MSAEQCTPLAWSHGTGSVLQLRMAPNVDAVHTRRALGKSTVIGKTEDFGETELLTWFT